MTLILSLILVTLQTYVVMPRMMRLFGPWLMSNRPVATPEEER